MLYIKKSNYNLLKILLFRRVAKQFVYEKMRKLEDQRENRQHSLLEQYLQNDQLDVKDVIGMAADMLLAGIDTVVLHTTRTVISC